MEPLLKKIITEILAFFDKNQLINMRNIICQLFGFE